MSKSRVMTCTCRNPYQDDRYGVGHRVYNLREKAKKWRCVTCGNERTVDGDIEALIKGVK